MPNTFSSRHKCRFLVHIRVKAIAKIRYGLEQVIHGLSCCNADHYPQKAIKSIWFLKLFQPPSNFTNLIVPSPKLSFNGSSNICRIIVVLRIRVDPSGWRRGSRQLCKGRESCS